MTESSIQHWSSKIFFHFFTFSFPTACETMRDMKEEVYICKLLAKVVGYFTEEIEHFSFCVCLISFFYHFFFENRILFGFVICSRFLPPPPHLYISLVVIFDSSTFWLLGQFFFCLSSNRFGLNFFFSISSPASIAPFSTDWNKKKKIDEVWRVRFVLRADIIPVHSKCDQFHVDLKQNKCCAMISWYYE